MHDFCYIFLQNFSYGGYYIGPGIECPNPSYTFPAVALTVHKALNYIKESTPSPNPECDLTI